MHNRLNELFPGHAGIDTDIVIAPSLAGAAGELLSRIGLADKNPLLVCDVPTHEALGERVAGELAGIETLVLDGRPHADEAALMRIRGKHCGALIAVGSGTLNDLCKYASHLDEKPYAVFPTAPSMNGYLSANASITLGGVKETRAAHLPKGVFCDLSVIAAAPPRLIRSGLGDSLCRPTAQADWLLSHLLLDTPYSALPFELLKPYEAELFLHADKLVRGDIHIIELLLKTLLVSGLGMTLAGGSYPASQGEHLIVHTMEMKHAGILPETYHGEQVGVATLTMAKLQWEMFSRPLRIPPLPGWEAALAEYFGRKRAQLIAAVAAEKYALYERYDELSARLNERDVSIREALHQISMPEPQLRAILQKAQAQTTAEGLGWRKDDYDAAVAHARFTRNRFTFLDLL